MNPQTSTHKKGYAPKKPRSLAKRYASNWAAYNRSLVQRGSITFWIDEKALAHWLCSPPVAGKRAAHRPQLYSDLAVETSLTLGQVFDLPLRACEGFVASVLELLGSELAAPDYSTLCRRQPSLELQLRRSKKRIAERDERGEPLHVVVDSSGLKICGEGEWQRLKHGWGRERTFRCVHLAIDPATDEIVAAALADRIIPDADVALELLESLDEPVGWLYGDGAYDKRKLYRELAVRQVEPVIPPRKNASRWRESEPGATTRNGAIETIDRDGFAAWREQSGYGRRALAETGMYRLKQHTSGRLSARRHDAQDAELILRCNILNKLAEQACLLGPADRFVPDDR